MKTLEELCATVEALEKAVVDLRNKDADAARVMAEVLGEAQTAPEGVDEPTVPEAEPSGRSIGELKTAWFAAQSEREDEVQDLLRFDGQLEAFEASMRQSDAELEAEVAPLKVELETLRLQETRPTNPYEQRVNALCAERSSLEAAWHAESDRLSSEGRQAQQVALLRHSACQYNLQSINIRAFAQGVAEVQEAGPILKAVLARAQKSISDQRTKSLRKFDEPIGKLNEEIDALCRKHREERDTARPAPVSPRVMAINAQIEAAYAKYETKAVAAIRAFWAAIPAESPPVEKAP